MKDINDMTDQEILSLTEEDIEKMIKLKAMDMGIRLVEKPKEPEYIQVEEPENTLYQIPELMGFFFGNKEDAVRISEAIRNTESLVKVDKDWCLCQYYHVVPANGQSLCERDGFDIRTVKVYANEEYDAIADKIRKNNAIRDVYSERMQEYRDFLDSISDIVDSTRGKAEEIRDKHDRLERLSYKLAVEYMPVTNGDEGMAMKFFEKAYSISDDDKSFILKNYHKYLTIEGDDTEVDENGGSPDTETDPLPHE